MNRRSIILVALFVLLLCPGNVYAHSPGGYLLATFSIVVLAAVLAALAKAQLVPFLVVPEARPRPRAYLCLSAVDVGLMAASIPAAMKVDSTGNGLVTLGIACAIYLIASLLPHFLLLRHSSRRIPKAMLLGLLFPTFLWGLTFAVFVPLYLLFGS